MKEAIQSGKKGSVHKLLEGLSFPQKLARLCTTYGGEGNYLDLPDDYNLYVQTSPILHAARCGNPEAFRTLLLYTDEVPGLEVSCDLVYVAEHPTRAIRQGFYEILDVYWVIISITLCPNSFYKHKLIVIPTTDYSSLVFSGRFASAFHFTQFTPRQAGEMIKARDGIGRTVIAMAASSGNRGMVDVVLKTVKDELDPTEVSKPLLCFVNKKK